MSDSDDNDFPELSAATFEVLQEFYLERENRARDSEKDEVEEDWQLSQFWYDEATANTLAKISLESVPPNGRIALISSPTLYKAIKNLIKERGADAVGKVVHLYEFDRRFSTLCGDDYYFYDYNSPLGNIPKLNENSYDVVLADPPFLSEQCITKTTETIKYLSKDRIIVCTGSVMTELLKQLLNLDKTQFEPRHQNNLANEFSCYTNYDISSFIVQ